MTKVDTSEMLSRTGLAEDITELRFTIDSDKILSVYLSAQIRTLLSSDDLRDSVQSDESSGVREEKRDLHGFRES